MLDVDLVLRVHELVVRRERLQSEVIAPEQHPQDDLARIGDSADGVHPRELVDVPAEAVRGFRVALGEEELELGSDDRLEAARGIGVDDTLEQRPRAGRIVIGPVERPRLAETPGHLRLPGDRAEGVEIGADGEVDIALLAADDRRVSEVGPHDRGAERDALLAQAREVPDRDVLPARDAVEIGVQQPDGAHAESTHRSRGRFGLLM